MHIAAIVVTYNDDYKLDEWIRHYKEYKDELYMHIIVDNCSKPDYVKLVEEAFNDSIIIKRSLNGGSTAAYNDGIRYALDDPDVDAIMLIGNDIRLEKDGASELYDFLMSDKAYGMVSPILLEKDSTIIADYGCEIMKSLTMKPYKVGEDISHADIRNREVEALTGGMNISKREFYEIVGLQDEKLFMYSDEVDMGIRARKKDYKLAATRDVRSWHEHINPSHNDTRHPFSMYLIGRNKVYLAKKHFNIFTALYVFFYYSKMALKGYISAIVRKNESGIQSNLWLLIGTINGLVGNMKHNKYSVPYPG